MINREAEIVAELEQHSLRRHLIETTTDGAYLEYNGARYINLSSNDYLGLSETELQQQFFDTLPTGNRFLMSNPSSRLMTGNSREYTQLEEAICQLYNSPAALVLGSGYLLGCGLLRAVTTKDDIIISDKLVHASIIDGIQLSDATHLRFRHNDTAHLERMLEKHSNINQRVVVVTESIFSMDGDKAPFAQLAELQQKFGFRLYLDEAHAFGVYGKNGCGLAEEYNATAQTPLRVDYLVATLGKALSSQGAFVVCDRQTRELLVNRMRTLIFSTALPPVSLMWSRFLIERLPDMADRRLHLASLVEIMGGESQIIPVMAGSNARSLQLVEQMCHLGYWATAIRHPTVPEGTARVRLSLTAALEIQHIEKFRELCNTIG